MDIKDKKISKADFIEKAYAVLAPEFDNVDEVVKADASANPEEAEPDLNNLQSQR